MSKQLISVAVRFAEWAGWLNFVDQSVVDSYTAAQRTPTVPHTAIPIASKTIMATTTASSINLIEPKGTSQQSKLEQGTITAPKAASRRTEGQQPTKIGSEKLRTPRKLILTSKLSLGDEIMLTAALRDLHKTYPNRFYTHVRTLSPELWENNPYLSPLDADTESAESIECHYPRINRESSTPYHCIYGFIQELNRRLGIEIRPTKYSGSIHLSQEEKSWYTQLYELTQCDIPFWIVEVGGNDDITTKLWGNAKFQEVVEHFRGKILFVQVGAKGRDHPKLHGTVDLRGQTTLRQLIRLIYHAEGSLCGATALMHLTAAVPLKHETRLFRPCVVVAGAREPAHWEAYSDHEFIHTVGSLECAIESGCWKDRVRPLGDGDRKDASENLCRQPVGNLARCMDMITTDEVVRRIELYYSGGALRYLTPTEAAIGSVTIEKTV